MSAPELAELMAFDSLYGFPDIYFLAGLICSTLEGLWSEKPRKIGEIIPYFGEGFQPSTTADMFQKIKAMAQRKQ